MKMVSPRRARCHCHSHKGISAPCLPSKGFLSSDKGGGRPDTSGWAGCLGFCFSSAMNLPCDLGEPSVPSGGRLSS